MFHYGRFLIIISVILCVILVGFELYQDIVVKHPWEWSELADIARMVLLIASIPVAMGSATWILTTYAAPLFAGLRSPVQAGRRWILVSYYCTLQAPIYWVYAKAWQLQYVPQGEPSNMVNLFALQFVQPVLWFR